VSALRRMGGLLNRVMAAASYRIHIAQANLWRDQYNPLRGLNITRAIHLLEEGERGAFADLQWTYRFIEMQDATIGALIELRISAIQELDWDIKVSKDVPTGKVSVAKRQATALKEAYARIGNLEEAIENLALASFRGFTRLEKVQDQDGHVIELAHVEQWFWVRKGLYGEWQLNSESRIGRNDGEPVPQPRFITREVPRPINRVGLIAFVRKGLSQKDWDGFIESYGIPAVFLIMPPDVPKEKEGEYFDTADQVVSDARGALPHGSDVKTVDNGARGNNPFEGHIDYQDKQVVLRGTSGQLTMLTQSGSGTLAGSAHADTFRKLAKAEAKEISGIFRRHFDREILDRVTPGEPAYAYFELAANEETDTGEIVKDVRGLAAAGYRVASKWLAEKTGYEVLDVGTTATRPGLALPQPRDLPLRNRAPEDVPQDDADAAQELRAALAEDLQPLGDALFSAFQEQDGPAFRAALKKVSAGITDFTTVPAFEAWLSADLTRAWIGEPATKDDA
jgi:phage gp29-like protein